MTIRELERFCRRIYEKENYGCEHCGLFKICSKADKLLEEEFDGSEEIINHRVFFPLDERDIEEVLDRMGDVVIR